MSSANMKKGNVNAAISLLTENMRNGILLLNNETFNLLRLKFRPKRCSWKCNVMRRSGKDTSSKVWGDRCRNDKESRNENKGRIWSLWFRRWLLETNFVIKELWWVSSDLCQTLAKVTKKHCTEELSTSFEGFLACRLIPLIINPGLRPIGVGEILRKIIGKFIVSVVLSNVISLVGALQVYAGHEAGCVEAIHAMHTIFEDEKTEAVLLVDAANAFDSVNSQVFLHSICIICPSMPHM